MVEVDEAGRDALLLEELPRPATRRTPDGTRQGDLVGHAWLVCEKQERYDVDGDRVLVS